MIYASHVSLKARMSDLRTILGELEDIQEWYAGHNSTDPTWEDTTRREQVLTDRLEEAGGLDSLGRLSDRATRIRREIQESRVK